MILTTHLNSTIGVCRVLYSELHSAVAGAVEEKPFMSCYDFVRAAPWCRVMPHSSIANQELSWFKSGWVFSWYFSSIPLYISKMYMLR